MPEPRDFRLSSHLLFNEETKAWEYWDDWAQEWCGPYATEQEAQEGYERNIYYQEHGEYPVSR